MKKWLEVPTDGLEPVGTGSSGRSVRYFVEGGKMFKFDAQRRSVAT